MHTRIKEERFRGRLPGYAQHMRIRKDLRDEATQNSPEGVKPLATFSPPSGKEGLRPDVNLDDSSALWDLMDEADGVFDKYRRPSDEQPKP